MSASKPPWGEIANWLKLQHGMSEADVLTHLGAPTTASQGGRDARRYRYGVVREGGNPLHSCGWVDFEGSAAKGFHLTQWKAPDLAEIEPPA
jgi:hypothetical protein